MFVESTILYFWRERERETVGVGTDVWKKSTHRSMQRYRQQLGKKRLFARACNYAEGEPALSPLKLSSTPCINGPTANEFKTDGSGEELLPLSLSLFFSVYVHMSTRSHARPKISAPSFCSTMENLTETKLIDTDSLDSRVPFDDFQTIFAKTNTPRQICSLEYQFSRVKIF